jgi:hypothetical protein
MALMTAVVVEWPAFADGSVPFRGRVQRLGAGSTATLGENVGICLALPAFELLRLAFAVATECRRDRAAARLAAVDAA